MDYLHRLTVLKHLHTEISTQLARELVDHSDQLRINEYYRLLDQVNGEVHRIQQMHSYMAASGGNNILN